VLHGLLCKLSKEGGGCEKLPSEFQPESFELLVQVRGSEFCTAVNKRRDGPILTFRRPRKSTATCAPEYATAARATMLPGTHVQSAAVNAEAPAVALPLE